MQVAEWVEVEGTDIFSYTRIFSDQCEGSVVIDTPEHLIISYWHERSVVISLSTTPPGGGGG